MDKKNQGETDAEAEIAAEGAGEKELSLRYENRRQVAKGGILGFFGVRELLHLLPFAAVALFAGLMTGAYPAVTDQLKGARPQKAHIVLFLVGLVVPILISAVTAFSSAGERSLDHPGAGQYILFLVLGIVLFATGVVVAYFFVKYERGKEKTEKL